MTTTVTDSNQVVIPPEIVRDFDIHPGMRLAWATTGDGAITITPLPSRADAARQLLGAGRRWLKPGGDPVGDLIRERERDDQLDQADEQQCPIF